MAMCTVCRRNLLSGEQYRFWRAPRESRAEQPVCGPCERRVAAAGWARAARPPGRENAIGLRGAVRLVA
jgi:hypothetical protein